MRACSVLLLLCALGGCHLIFPFALPAADGGVEDGQGVDQGTFDGGPGGDASSTGNDSTGAADHGPKGDDGPRPDGTSHDAAIGPLPAAWARALGSTSFDSGWGLAVDKNENIYVTGSFNGTVDFGGGPRTSLGADDVFLVSFNPSGVHRWSKTFGSVGPDRGYGLAVDSSSNVYMVGISGGSLTFDGVTVLMHGGNKDLFVASFTSSGAHRWSKGFGDAANQTAWGVAVDGGGSVYVTGDFEGSVSFGGKLLGSKGKTDIFLVSFTSTGAHRWSKSFGDTSFDSGTGVAVDASGNVYATGYYEGKVTFGGTLTSSGYSDAYVASFNPTGAHRWSETIGGAKYDHGRGIGVAGTSVYVAGLVAGELHVSQYTTAGTHQWTRQFGAAGAGASEACSVASDPAGGAVATGFIQGAVDFDGTTLTSAGGQDLVVARFTSNGTTNGDVTRIGGLQTDRGTAVAAGPSGNIYVLGYFSSSGVTVGGKTLPNAGADDILLLKLKP